MLIISKQSIEESANEARTGIQLDSLNEVKDILASSAFTSDEKIHLIKSRFIVEKAEMAELDRVIENIGTLPAKGAACCTACEAEAPVGQMTIFEFLGADGVPGEEPNEVPEEFLAFVQELAGVLQSAFGK